MHRQPSPQQILTRFATAFDGEGEEDDDEPVELSIEVPEDLTALDRDELDQLVEDATEAFHALHEAATAEDGDLTVEALEQLEALADAIEDMATEAERRAEQDEELVQRAESIVARVEGDVEDDDDDTVAEDDDEDTEASVEDEDDDETESVDEDNDETAEVSEDERETVAASGAGERRPLSIRVAGHRRRAPSNERQDDAPYSLTASGDVPGLSNGEEVDWNQLANAVIRRTRGINPKSFETAYKQGRRRRDQFSLATLHKNMPDELMLRSSDDSTEVIRRVTNERRLPGGSLTAAGGWCAPSETRYDLFDELETTDGILSVPEMGIERGGVSWVRGPDFATLFSEADLAFDYTEAEDEAGDYDGAGGGTKPCFKVTCPPFEEARLDLVGLCITAGILQNRAYPEVVARTIRGALVAHEHRVAAKVLAAQIAGSTAVAAPGTQSGAVAPVLSTVELQAAHYRNVHRMSDDASLEAKFPRWVRGLFRHDLSRRLGVDLLEVSNARINEWFTSRNIAVQWIYNFDDLSGTADTVTEWPSTVRFLLYAAGTWVKGVDDVITMENLYDSSLLDTNDFTALFTEEGVLVAKTGHDSRIVTVEVEADGSVHAGVDITHDGTVAV